MQTHRNFFRVPLLFFGLIVITSMYYFVSGLGFLSEEALQWKLLFGIGLFSISEIPFIFLVFLTVFRKQILKKENHIATWEYEPDEWELFINAFSPMIKLPMRGFGSALAFMSFIFGIVLLIFTTNEIGALFFFAIGLLYIAIAFLGHKNILNTMLFRPGYVIISTKGLFIDGIIIPINNLVKLSALTFNDEKKQLEFTLKTDNNKDAKPQKVKLPIPRNAETNIEEIKQKMMDNQ